MATYVHKDTGTKFHAHVSLLCHYSPFFKKALTGSFSESESKTVEIHDVELWVLEAFHNWLYFKVYRYVTSEHIRDDEEPECYNEMDLIHAICFADKYSVPQLLMEEAEDLGFLLNRGHGSDSEALLFVQDHLPESSPVMAMIAEAVARYGIKDNGENTVIELKPSFVMMIAKRVIKSRERQKKRNGNVVVPGRKMNIKKLLRASTEATLDKGQDDDDQMSVDDSDSD